MRSPSWERCSSSSALALPARGGRREGPPTAGSPPDRVYLALGDSLAASFQPTATRTAATRSRSLSSSRRDPEPTARQARLSPASARTRSIGRGACVRTPRARSSTRRSRCSRARTLRSSRSRSARTIRSVLPVRSPAFDQACIDELLPKISARLTSIVETLRSADPDVPIVGSNYLDPLLALGPPRAFPTTSWWPSRTCGPRSTTRSSRRTRRSACRWPTSRRRSPTTDFDTIVHIAASATPDQRRAGVPVDLRLHRTVRPRLPPEHLRLRRHDASVGGRRSRRRSRPRPSRRGRGRAPRGSRGCGRAGTRRSRGAPRPCRGRAARSAGSP